MRKRRNKKLMFMRYRKNDQKHIINVSNVSLNIRILSINAYNVLI